jgi:hypothetical protein
MDRGFASADKKFAALAGDISNVNDDLAAVETRLAACRTEVFGRGAATARGHLMLP